MMEEDVFFITSFENKWFFENISNFLEPLIS